MYLGSAAVLGSGFLLGLESTPGVSLPGNMTVCGIKGHFDFTRLLAGDDDGVMDLVPLAGLVVTFTPNPKFLINATAPKPTVIVPQPMVLTTDSSGDLRDADGNSVAYLIATNNTALSPTGWTYTISFSGTGASAFSTISKQLPGGQTIDLATLMT